MKPRDGGSVTRKVFIPWVAFTLSGLACCIHPRTSPILSMPELHADLCARIYLIPYGFSTEKLKMWQVEVRVLLYLTFSSTSYFILIAW